MKVYVQSGCKGHCQESGQILAEFSSSDIQSCANHVLEGASIILLQGSFVSENREMESHIPYPKTKHSTLRGRFPSQT